MKQILILFLSIFFQICILCQEKKNDEVEKPKITFINKFGQESTIWFIENENYSKPLDKPIHISKSTKESQIISYPKEATEMAIKVGENEEAVKGIKVIKDKTYYILGPYRIE